MNDTLIKFEGLTKVFLTDEVETRVLWDHQLGNQARRLCLHCGPLRVRQVLLFYRFSA